MNRNRNVLKGMAIGSVILAGMAVIAAVIAAFFADLRDMSKTPLPTRIATRSLFLGFGMLLVAYVLGGIHSGGMLRRGFSLLRNKWVRVGRADNPIRFWLRVVFFGTVAAGFFWASAWAFMGGFLVASP